MLPALPILVFGTVFIMWSRTSLAPAKAPPPTENNASKNNIIVKVIGLEESA